MSAKRTAWISRRGQSGAEAAIDQVIDRHPQPGEQIEQISDELIENSPFQARAPFSDESVEELAQGMREAGFQGVLILRPHGDPLKRRRGLFQLVYGHRRRIAWCRVCAERDRPCLLPVVIRDISDEHMLTIGAQENLQRQDLDPLEEAQIVAWHERVFSDKNQAEIGQMLGKSSDWVSVRARIHRLPEALKERLRERPRAIGQMLEVAGVYTQQPDLSVMLADRVVQENLTLEAVRALVRVQRQDDRAASNRERGHNRRVNATSVAKITNDKERPLISPLREASQAPESDTNHGDGTTLAVKLEQNTPAGEPLARASNSALDLTQTSTLSPTDKDPGFTLLLQEVALSLDTIAARAEALPGSAAIIQALDQAERALARIRAALTRFVAPRN